MTALLSLAALLLLQAPGDGFGMVDTRPREVRRLYWDLFQTTEVWVTLSPVTQNTVAGPRFAVQALFPGREVKGPPGRIQVKALVDPVGNDTSFRVTVNGKAWEVTGAGGDWFLLRGDYGTFGIVAALTPEVLRAMAGSANVTVSVLGVELRLSPQDVEALAEFARQIELDRR